VRELTLTVPAGEICCLVGPSGAGKTTAMKMVNRLIDITRATSDRRHERAVARRDRAPARHRLRDPAGRPLPAHDRRGRTSHGAAPARLAEGADRERVDELLDLVGLAGVDYRAATRRSSRAGSASASALARALAADPPVMLMDEPFGALDPITRARSSTSSCGIQHELRKTIVFVTHDIDEAILLGDRIAILREGGVFSRNTTRPDALLAHQPTMSWRDFLGLGPGTQAARAAQADELDLAPARRRRAGPDRGRLDDVARRALADDHRGKPLAGRRRRGRTAAGRRHAGVADGGRRMIPLGGPLARRAR
jgi:osmoprotectant transport system ATP-binding protein